MYRQWPNANAFPNPFSDRLFVIQLCLPCFVQYDSPHAWECECVALDWVGVIDGDTYDRCHRSKRPRSSGHYSTISLADVAARRAQQFSRPVQLSISIYVCRDKKFCMLSMLWYIWSCLTQLIFSFFTYLNRSCAKICSFRSSLSDNNNKPLF